MAPRLCHSYPGLLGIRLPTSVLRTGDLDVAPFHSISVSIDDSLPQMLDVLRKVDDSFAAVPHLADPNSATRFVNGSRFAVEFLTPNTSKDEYLGRPAEMPALGARRPSPCAFSTS